MKQGISKKIRESIIEYELVQELPKKKLQLIENLIAE